MIDVETYAAAKKYADEHGGGGGTTNYNALDNKPQIAGTTLQGDKSLADLGIASAEALANKVDKVEGKGLSTNDYDNTEKGKVADNAGAIEATQDMISDAYDATATYAVGDYCIYNDILYKCNTAIVTGEAFTPAKWDATNVAEELGELTERVNGARLTVKLYTANFVANGYVSPAAAIFDEFIITAADVEEYGIPVSGSIMKAGYPVSSNFIFTKSSSSGYRVLATSYEAGNQDIYIQFLKL